jgi:hypothetical protein
MGLLLSAADTARHLKKKKEEIFGFGDRIIPYM